MTFALDHVVIAVADLAKAIEDYRALGFTVVPGGRHPGRTSHNALVVFEDGSYLEIIAWAEPGPAERWYNVLSKHGEGLMDFALLPASVPAAVAAAKARGLALNGLVNGGRVRPDGRELKWQTGRQTTFDLPFLCGDVTPRSLRVPEGEVRRHANGVTGVASLSVAVHDLEVSLARYRALLGPDGGGVCVGEPFVLPDAGIRLATVRLGATAIVLATPSGAAAREPAQAAWLRERLANRGEWPCALALRLAPGSAAVRFDPALTHAVPLEAGGWPVPG